MAALPVKLLRYLAKLVNGWVPEITPPDPRRARAWSHLFHSAREMPGQFRGVFEPDMHDACPSRERRAMLIRMTADRDHVVEFDGPEVALVQDRQMFRDRRPGQGEELDELAGAPFAAPAGEEQAPTPTRKVTGSPAKPVCEAGASSIPGPTHLTTHARGCMDKPRSLHKHSTGTRRWKARRDKGTAYWKPADN